MNVEILHYVHRLTDSIQNDIMQMFFYPLTLNPKREIMKTILTLILLMIISTTNINAQSILKQQLNQNWSFSEAEKNEWQPATVPGNIHTDLLNLKKIKDPFFGTNESELQWIGETDWSYKTTFDVSAELLSKKNIRLTFSGLDTYSDVYLNGVKILTTDNMFREWKVDAKPFLISKNNKMVIRFRNVFSENNAKWETAPYRLQAFPNNDQADTMIALYSRKAQFHYGWDWGPRLVTCGIWKPIILEGWNEIKMESFHIYSSNVSEEKATIVGKSEVNSAENKSADFVMKINGKQVAKKTVQLSKGMNQIEISYEMKNPKLWWSNGLGEQYRYETEIQIEYNSEIVDSRKIKVGVRDLKILREKDKDGKSFTVSLNGHKVFMKGANYIPSDNFENRVTRDILEYTVKSAADANMNMLRVWGGGIYQSDDFYDLCDQYGILIWQDMIFACAMYPSDPAFLESVRQELLDNFKRIRNYTSIALYCGNNENEVGWNNWGWKQKYSEDIQKEVEANMIKLYYETVQGTLKEVDPDRYFTGSSPIAGYLNSGYGDGDIHYWGVWHGKDPFSKYEDNIARFVSEYGFQSYPELSTVNKYALPEDKELHSPVMLSHQRCMADDRKDKEYGNRLIKHYMDGMYKEPKDFEAYLYVSQLVQAEGVRLAIEAHRRNMPYCMGTLYWQINDCWPVASWSSIDYFGNWKALHYYAKELYKDVIAAPLVKENKFSVSVVSDKLKDLDAELKISIQTFDGKEIYSLKKPVTIKSNTSEVVFSELLESVLKGQNKSDVVAVISLDANRKSIYQTSYYFTDYKILNLKNPELKWDITKTKSGYDVKIKTKSLAKSVYVYHPTEQLFANQNFFDLFSGETKTISIKTSLSETELKKSLRVISLVDSFLGK